jgi:phenylacetic acid degradation operon negative regulatory protein
MRTTDLLTALLYGFDLTSRPKARRFTAGSENWIRENGLRSGDWDRLRENGLLEGERLADGSWQGKLTDAGWEKALGGRDPERQWNRTWDGRWRIVLFDLKKPTPKMRQRLSRWLHAHQFGCAQRSVWVSPDPCPPTPGALAAPERDPASVMIVETDSIRGIDAPVDIVAAAWDFDAINGAYRDYLDFIQARSNSGSIDFAWSKQERLRWLDATKRDPMLPDSLLPDGYLGKHAWEERKRLLSRGISG